MEASIKYTSIQKRADRQSLSLDGDYTFRPLTLSDINQYTDPLQTDSLSVDLDSWGKVNFVTVLILGYKPHAAAFLTNEHGDIFYEFGPSFHTGTKIIDFSIEDIDGDGLKDIKVVAGFFDYDTGLIKPDMPYVEWAFCQTDEGLFYASAEETMPK